MSLIGSAFLASGSQAFTNDRRDSGNRWGGRPGRAGGRVLAWLLPLLLALRAAPVPALEAPQPFEPLPAKYGLAEARVFAIHQDRWGFLWFATAGGLSRYDGHSLKTFGPGDTPASLPAAEVTALLEDEDGLWIGTWGGGLARFDPRRETFTRFEWEAPGTGEGAVWQISSLFKDRRGRLWVGTFGLGLGVLDPHSGTFRRHVHAPDDPASLSHDYVWSLAGQGDGTLWVGTEAGLDRLHVDDGRFEATQLWPEEPEGAEGPEAAQGRRVRTLFFDSAGTLWAGTDGEVRILPRGSEQFRPLPATGLTLAANTGFHTIREDSAGRVWFGTMEHGLLCFDRTTGRLMAMDLGRDGSPARPDVRAVFEDRSQNLWLGTFGGGPGKMDLKPPKFQLYRPSALATGAAAVGDDGVHAVYEDGDGRLWLGTADGLVSLDRRRQRSEHYRYDNDDPGGPAEGRVQAVVEDEAGRLWVGTSRGGLCRFDPERESFQCFSHREFVAGSLSHDAVTSVLETRTAVDRSGRLWVGTDGGGLNRFDPDSQTFTHFRHDPRDPNSLSHDRVTVLYEDDLHTLWVGTEGGGLNRFFPSEGQFRRYRHEGENPHSLSDDRVLSLLQDRGGVLWVGTRRGLDRFESYNESFSRQAVEGLPEASVLGLLEDDEGALWLATSAGLVRYFPATGRARIYGAEEGLPPGGLTLGAVHRGAGGEFFVGSEAGLHAFSPQRVVDNPFRPPTVLVGLRIFNQEVEAAQPLWSLRELELSHKDTRVALEFAALDFTAPERNRFAWRYADNGAEWQELAGRQLVFEDLEPGIHHVEVRAANNDGVWSSQPLALALDVTRPVWRTWWFRSSAGTLLLAVVLWLGASRYRTLLIEKRNAELEVLVASRTAALRERSEQLEGAYEELRRFAFLASHDLRTPLVTMRGFVGELRSTLQEVRQHLQPALAKLDPASAAGLGRSLNEDAEEALDFIDSASSRMASHNQALLELARLGGRELELQEVDVGDVVGEILRGLEGEIERGQVEVCVGPLPEVVVDRFFLERILRNLLLHALDSLSGLDGRRNGHREPRPGRITVTGEKSESATVICVQDNGRGIPEKELPRVFDVFRRIGEVDSPAEGIGLAYVQVMVRQLRGRISCTSKVGEGTTFTFSISNSLGEAPV